MKNIEFRTLSIQDISELSYRQWLKAKALGHIFKVIHSVGDLFSLDTSLRDILYAIVLLFTLPLAVVLIPYLVHSELKRFAGMGEYENAYLPNQTIYGLDKSLFKRSEIFSYSD